MNGPFDFLKANPFMELLAAEVFDFRIRSELVASFRPGERGGRFDEACRHVLLPRGFDDVNPFYKRGREVEVPGT